MRKIIYLLFLAVITGACSNTKKQTGIPTDLSFSKTEYKEESSIPEKGSTRLTAIIPIANGENDVAKSINDSVFNATKLIIAQDGDNSRNYEDLFKGFIKNYEAFVSDNQDYKLGWEANITGSVEYYNNDIVNIKLVSYTMTGGAHGNPNTTSLIFRTKDGKALSIKDLVKDPEKLSKQAEIKFREKYNLSSDQAINSTGFMFPDDKFILPQNIFITKDGFLLFYNVYEIAAYVDGTKELFIPYEEIKGNLLVDIK